MSVAIPEPRRAVAPALLVAVFVGGAGGALARAGLSEAWPAGDGWPWGTLTANLSGTAILAVLALALTVGTDPNRVRRALLGTGFCGALTTFSAFQIETIALAKRGDPGLAVAYAGASVIAGLAIVIGINALLRRVRFG